MQTIEFNISLTVLQHLGRNLYKNFSTALGEALSNSWDADAKSVSIKMNKKNYSFSIKDDGIGMNQDDFINKFLKIGYSKRRNETSKSSDGRPYIGRKGIGKLALLSCCEELHIISKKKDDEVTGAIINNNDLNKEIAKDNGQEKYQLKSIDKSPYKNILDDQEHGTYLFFKKVNNKIRHTPEYIRKTIALSFLSSLSEPNFNIRVNDNLVTEKDLEQLISKTQFMWCLNNTTGNNPFNTALKKEVNHLEEIDIPTKNSDEYINGFIATVQKPNDLQIREIDEKVSLDLFVNGRLREKDILKHFKITGVVSNYIYGQINFDALDDEIDRFTSSREGIVEGDEKFKKLIELLKPTISQIRQDWDKLRLDRYQEGDPENTTISPIERKSNELAGAVANDYALDSDKGKKKISKDTEVEKWAKELRSDAAKNYSAYAQCFTSENLIRKYIKETSKSLTNIPANHPKTHNKITMKKLCEHYRQQDKDTRDDAGLNITVREDDDDLYYLAMQELIEVIYDKTKGQPKKLTLIEHSKVIKPLRNAVMHTSVLTREANTKLSSILDDIKARLQTITRSS